MLLYSRGRTEQTEEEITPPDDAQEEESKDNLVKVLPLANMRYQLSSCSWYFGNRNYFNHNYQQKKKKKI